MTDQWFYFGISNSEGENVDTRLEAVDKLTNTVSGTHLSFDLDDNITRIDYFDLEKGANIRRVEQKDRDSYESAKRSVTCRHFNGHLYSKMRLEIMGSVFWCATLLPKKRLLGVLTSRENSKNSS